MKKILCALLTLVMALSVCAAVPAEGKTFVYGIDGDPGNDINTITTAGRYDLMMERMLYSTLYNYYGPDDITYLLAEKLETSEDKMVYTVHLRKDVTWSDGVPFTADDVVFTYGKIIEFDYANGHEAFVYDGKPVQITKIDDYTVEFKLPVMASNFIEALTAEHYIMPRHIYEGDEKLDNNPKNQTPVGTGPYTLVEYQAGQHIKFAARKDYFRGAPKIDTVVFRIVGDASSAALALKKGEINALTIAPAAADDYAGTDIVINAYPEDRVGYMSFVMGSPRVQDINFRKACFYAINRTEMNMGAYLSKDYYVDAVSFLPYAAAFYTDEVESYATDLEKAKEYLSKVKDIPTLKLAYGNGNAQQEIQGMVIQQNLKAIGVKVELVAMDGMAMFDKLKKGTDEFDMYLGGYIMGVDPNNYATLFVSNSASNFSKMKDEELDKLFLDGSIEPDDSKRAEIYKKAQQRLADLAVFYPIATNKRLLAVSGNVGGMEEARLVPIYTFEDMSKLYFK